MRHHSYLWLLGLFYLAFLSSGLSYSQERVFSFSDSAIIQRLKTDISILASDSLEGREAGTRGDTMASVYIINRFMEIGLQPANNDSGSYLQQVTFDYNDFPRDENFLHTDHRAYKYPKDFGMTSFSSNDKINGELLDVGHGICDSVLAFNDYSGKENPSERVLLMEFPLPENLANDSTTLERLSIRERLEEAFRRGALGVILWNSDSPEYPELFDFKHPSTLQGAVIFVAADVARALKKSEGQSVYLMATRLESTKKYNNVIGFLNNQASQTVIVGAHYDHVGINHRGNPRCGADDNASGVAMMLELARYLQQHCDSSFNYLFIAFGAEELGMIGSGYFCEHPVIPLDEIAYMCNFDMVGRLGAEGNRITALATETSPQWNIIYRDMPKFPFKVKRYKGPSSFSDQECFYKKKVPVFYITTGLHADYHTYRDTPDRINYTGMIPIAKFAEEFIIRTEKIGHIDFQKVSGKATFFSDLNYYIKQIGHLFDMPLQDFP
ncbi:MAG: M28 family peptidase [Bacteroidales bacterium]|nr:M28 family peptidase [Bacteroidales bacterium]